MGSGAPHDLRKAGRLDHLQGPGIQTRPVLQHETKVSCMANVSKKRLSKIARQKMAMRASLWPDLDESKLWMRKRSDGWLSVPRSMPLLLQIMDSLSKGKPVSSTYFDLWCRTYDDSFVIANKDREMAFFSGFTGERAVRTWATRMRILRDLGFIDIKEGPNGPISYVLIFNPYTVVRQHHEAGQVNDAFFNSLTQRMIEIGAQDFDEPSHQIRPARKTKAKSASELLKKQVMW